MKSTAARKLRQVPQGYLVIGVDPHKKKHAAVTITQDFTTWAKFKFDNSMEGFEMMLQRSRVEMTKTGCRGVIFAIETGGHYWRNLAYFLEIPSWWRTLISQTTYATTPKVRSLALGSCICRLRVKVNEISR